MKKYFLTGLIILLPLAVTVAIVIFVVNFLTQPFIGVAVDFLSSISWGKQRLSDLVSPKFIWYSSRLVILAGLFLFTLFLGAMARWFFVRSLLKLSDKILNRIPLVNKIYKTTQEIIKTFFSTDSQSFKKVVLIPFPSPGIYCMGLVSREAPKMVTDHFKRDLVSVFIPTTPNPTSGFILMFDKKDIIELPIKTEDALKFIVSCGVIHPESLSKKLTSAPADKVPKKKPKMINKTKAASAPAKAITAKKQIAPKKTAAKGKASPKKTAAKKTTKKK